MSEKLIADSLNFRLKYANTFVKAIIKKSLKDLESADFRNLSKSDIDEMFADEIDELVEQINSSEKSGEIINLLRHYNLQLYMEVLYHPEIQEVHEFQEIFSKKEKEYWMKCSLLGPGDESKLRDSTVFDEEFYEFLEFKMLDMLRAENFLILRILYDPHERISKEVFFNLLANIASSSKKAVDMFIDNPDKLGAQSISFTRNSELFDFYNVISSVINSKLKNEILFKRDLDALNLSLIHI